jgi:hypothetical protein
MRVSVLASASLALCAGWLIVLQLDAVDISVVRLLYSKLYQLSFKFTLYNSARRKYFIKLQPY